MENIQFNILGKETLKNKANNEGLSDLRFPEVFPQSFFMLIIGKPGSGKTTVIEELLLNQNFLNNKFDYVIVFSPYPFNNIELVKDENYFSNFDLAIIYSAIDKINNSSKDTYSNLLIIFDDYISEIRKEANNPKFTRLFYNRRHLLKNGCVSFIMTSQKFVVTPPQIRPCINVIILFQLNASEYSCMKKDVCSWIDMKFIGNLLKNIYDFIFINIANGNIYLNLKTKI